MEQKKKILLLTNGTSGRGLAREKLFDILEELTVRGGQVTVYPIVPSRGLVTADYLRQTLGEHSPFDVVACMGGDGTLNHVVSDLMALECRPVVGYIPSGSTNDFANSLGLTDQTLAACETIMSGREFAIDVGRFNDRYFNYVAGFGAFTDVSYETGQDIKNVLGHAAYILQGMMTLPHALSCRVHMRIETDGVPLQEGDYIYGAVSNATSIGGFASMGADSVKMDDGLFEVMLIRAPRRLSDLNSIVTSLLSGKPDNKYVEFFRTDSLQLVSSEPVNWTLDGEFGGSRTQVDIRLCHRAITILVPQQEKAEQPVEE